ncbi:MAG: hypothetical protein ACLRYE_08335 [Gemmiger formicilis]|uniref:hypothetical protein n=1 Tax=Gemmiger formicilis TaxID=745368 RepID=UPI0039A2350F
MRNTLLLQLPGVRKLCLYYIAVLMLLSVCLIGTACPAYAEETADSSSNSTSDSTDTTTIYPSAADITDAYDKYAGGVDSGLDDIKEQYDGVVNDSVASLRAGAGTRRGFLTDVLGQLSGLSVGSLVVLGIVIVAKG